MRPVVVALLVVGLVGVGVGGFALGSRIGAKPAAKVPLGETLPCGDALREKMLIDDLPIGSNTSHMHAQCVKGHAFIKIEGTWVPSPPRPEIGGGY